METELDRWAPHYSLVVDIEIADVHLGVPIKARTTMLSLSGCVVDTLELFPKGLSVSVKLSHGEAEVKALGRVLYARLDLGMGLAFTNIEPAGRRILDWWMDEFLNNPVRKH